MLINGFMCRRIDKELFEKISIKCKLFLEKAILPKFLAIFFSESTIDNEASPGKVCYCNMSNEEDDLIGSDHKNCQIKWCLHITKIPKGL